MIPNINPNIFPIYEIFPSYNLFDLGINSPDIIYNIVPAAKLKHNAIILLDIPPNIAPINAPIPVVIPENITYLSILLFFIPPLFIGIAIDTPSGKSCKHIIIAKLNPNSTEPSNPDPIAKPFWNIMYRKSN